MAHVLAIDGVSVVRLDVDLILEPRVGCTILITVTIIAIGGFFVFCKTLLDFQMVYLTYLDPKHVNHAFFSFDH
jgi:hypothetical protein